MINMRKAAAGVVFAGALIMILMFFGCTRVGPGYVGIKVSMAGTNRGVDAYPATTGWVFYNRMTESVFEYPTFVQTAKWTRDPNEGHPVNEEITFTNKDSMLISADISLSYTLRAERVPAFYVKFRSDDLDKFTHGYLRNVARDMFNETAGKYSIEQIMGDNGPFLSEVRQKLQAQVEAIGVVIEQFGLIGDSAAAGGGHRIHQRQGSGPTDRAAEAERDYASRGRSQKSCGGSPGSGQCQGCRGRG